MSPTLQWKRRDLVLPFFYFFLNYTASLLTSVCSEIDAIATKKKKLSRKERQGRGLLYAAVEEQLRGEFPVVVENNGWTKKSEVFARYQLIEEGEAVQAEPVQLTQANAGQQATVESTPPPIVIETHLDPVVNKTLFYLFF